MKSMSRILFNIVGNNRPWASLGINSMDEVRMGGYYFQLKDFYLIQLSKHNSPNTLYFYNLKFTSFSSISKHILNQIRKNFIVLKKKSSFIRLRKPYFNKIP